MQNRTVLLKPLLCDCCMTCCIYIQKLGLYIRNSASCVTHTRLALFFEGLDPHGKEKSKSMALANHGPIIADEITFVKRIFVLENMTTCIVK